MSHSGFIPAQQVPVVNASVAWTMMWHGCRLLDAASRCLYGIVSTVNNTTKQNNKIAEQQFYIAASMHLVMAQHNGQISLFKFLFH